VLKATSELSENLFSGETEAWSDWHPYIFIIITFSGAAFQVCPSPIGCTYRSCGITRAVLQLSCLNKGLALSDTTKYLPVYNAELIVLSSFFG